MQTSDLSGAPEQANSSADMLNRYQWAQCLNQGAFSPSVARNSTLFPVWIEGSHTFWYERELEDGREFRLVNVHQQQPASL